VAVTRYRAQIDELLADYHRSREQLASVQRRLSSISESAGSADGLVTATVGSRGTLTGLRLDEQVYERYRPEELAEQIVRAAAAAAVQALDDVAALLAPILPAGTDAQALLLGTADLHGGEIVPDSGAAGDVEHGDRGHEDAEPHPGTAPGTTAPNTTTREAEAE
jgi:DNA-binding protein YbaB